MDCTIPHDSIIRLIDCIQASSEMDGDILEVGTGVLVKAAALFYNEMTSIIESYGLNKKTVDGFESQVYLPNLSYEPVSKKLEGFPFVILVKGYAPQIYTVNTVHILIRLHSLLWICMLSPIS
jgi:hypothetical protein